MPATLDLPNLGAYYLIVVLGNMVLYTYSEDVADWCPKPHVYF